MRLMHDSSDGRDSSQMTSMIDVVFLLLIFFMCATQFKVPEGSLRAFLPKSEGQDSTDDPIIRKCRIRLHVASDGEVRVRIDERDVPGQTDQLSWYERERGVPAPDETVLRKHLLERKNNHGGLSAEGLPVVIDFDGNVPVEHVIRMVNLCHETRIQSIAFAIPEIDSQ